MLILGTALLQLASFIPVDQQGQGENARRFPDFPDQDTLSYSLDLHVDIEKSKLTGSVEYRIKALADLKTVRFHARRSDDWQVEFRSASGEVLEAAWNEKSQQVAVTLQKPVAKGAEIKLRAALSGTPVDGFYFKENRHGQKMAFTDHYSIRARGWLPCEDHPSERAAWRVRVVFPEKLQSIAYGLHMKSTGSAAPKGFREATSASNTEIPPYMFALVVGPFARIEEKGDPRIKPHFVYAADVERAKTSLRHHAKWMAIMEKTFGPYSYLKYTTVQCPTRWGGFESPGNVQLSERLFDGADGGVGTLAHEFVHMWFGDAVGYSRWREVWLSEGFASYFGPWLNAAAGGPDMKKSMQRIRTRWLKSRDGRIKSIRDDSFRHPDLALNSNTYPKGAWVLHMLRRELGDDLFFECLKQYYVRCHGRSIVTKEFVAIVQEVSKRDLGWFFDQWLDRVGCPDLLLELKPTRGPQQHTLTQTQKGEPYTFWLKLRWKLNGGKSTMQTMRVTKRVTEFTAPGGVRYDGLDFDPDVELLHRLKTK